MYFYSIIIHDDNKIIMFQSSFILLEEDLVLYH